MPSFDHEILVDLFRDDGTLAAELLRTSGLAIDHARVEPASIDLTQVVPAEYRADTVAVLQGRDGRPVTGIIVEVQRKVDRDKRLSWPVYVAALRAQLDCPAVLLVVAPKPAVAAWARRPIELGHPGFRLTPLVVGFADVPRVRDRTAASQLPQLAVLSVLAHRELELRDRHRGDRAAAGGSDPAILGCHLEGAAGKAPANPGGADATLRVPE